MGTKSVAFAGMVHSHIKAFAATVPGGFHYLDDKLGACRIYIHVGNSATIQTLFDLLMELGKHLT
jgi:hypothetical protein